jgi:hypothetical protein
MYIYIYVYVHKHVLKNLRVSILGRQGIQRDLWCGFNNSMTGQRNGNFVTTLTKLCVLI